MSYTIEVKRKTEINQATFQTEYVTNIYINDKVISRNLKYGEEKEVITFLTKYLNASKTEATFTILT